MKILHTSDWHLGRSLYNRRRYDEFAAFLDWLIALIEEREVDALLVAGDVFDTGTPGNRAQRLYYDFLRRAASSSCRHVVVIGGNHDSPTFLNAPKELLRILNVHVVGSAAEDPAEEVIVLDREGTTEALVCAVPYLRDRDIRTAEPGESLDEKNAKLVEGVKEHYGRVCAAAEERRKALDCGDGVPMIGMGHLFTAGGRTTDDDGVRELYVGSLAHVEREVFPRVLDYLALGHLHVPQRVGGAEHIRYSGSPLPMGFGEARQEKQVVLLDFAGRSPVIEEVPVPCFQELVRLTGDLEELRKGLTDLMAEKSRAWLELEYTGEELLPHLRELIREETDSSELEVLRIKNRPVMNRILRSMEHRESLDDLDENQVFARCLEAYRIPPEEREGLTASYKEVVRSLKEADRNAE
ncbi:MAG: exonuclease SbcCD subunit D C-terminal domain-containing protein [Spirochaetales bacterium]|nr:exonuclease SbcCD subunit D C-terminal domain-containing protein [Spirochaetales bacterium]